MRNILAFVVGMAAMTSVAGAWDVSPTQTPSAPIVRQMTANPAEELMESIFHDDDLLTGIEQLSLTPDGRRIRSMMGRLSEPLEGDLAAAGLSYLREHGRAFNVPTDKSAAVKLHSMTEGGGATHMTYVMTIGGYPVHEALVELHVGPDRRVQLANGSFPTIEAIANQESIDAALAMNRARQMLGVSGLRGDVGAELVVFPVEHGEGRLAWLVNVPAKEPFGDWEVVLDAETGSELSRLNQMAFNRATIAEPNGQGAVYRTNPLDGVPVIAWLYHLTSQSLVGAYANVVNSKGGQAVSESNYHVYAPDDTHFDEVNMYFNITRIHDFFKTLGVSTMDFSMKAEVHFGTNYDNAYYSPQTNSMAFGDGSKLNDLSKEAGIAWHEYSHATLQSIKSLNYKGESGAINEGQADYFSCTISGDPRVGPWTMNKLGKPWLRNLTDQLHYPEDIKGEVHQDGRIWAAALWDLRKALGAGTSDLLIQKSFFYIPAGNPTFLDGMNAILAADKNLNAGANQNQIRAVFAARGIGKAPGTLVFNGPELARMKRFATLHP